MLNLNKTSNKTLKVMWTKRKKEKKLTCTTVKASYSNNYIITNDKAAV